MARVWSADYIFPKAPQTVQLHFPSIQIVQGSPFGSAADGPLERSTAERQVYVAAGLCDPMGATAWHAPRQRHGGERRPWPGQD